MKEPLVSIISPYYNGERYIKNFLDSVVNQTYSNIELIIINDASTDNTESIVESYSSVFKAKNYILKSLKRLENGGQAAAINDGLRVFSGEFLMWMDADDILLSNAISEKVEYLIKTGLDFALCQGEIVRSSDLESPIGILKRIPPLENDNLFSDYVFKKNVVWCPGSIIVKSSALKKAIPSLHIYESREGQNAQLMLPLSYSCSYGYIEHPLFKYVIHADSHSHRLRSYEELIQRSQEAYRICDRTISEIVDMPQEEKKYWISESEKIKFHEMYIYALDRFKIKDSYIYYKMLKKLGYKLSQREMIYSYYLIKLGRKIKTCLKKFVGFEKGLLW